MTLRHKVLQVEPLDKTGVCSECGPTPLYRSGTSAEGLPVWRCATRALASQNARWEEVKGAARASRFLRLYGITVEEYEERLEAQGGVCLRCGDPPAPDRRLAVDHCHEDLRFRGLLCGPCNTYLGRLEANLDRLLTDLEYIGSPLATVIAASLAERQA